MDNERLKYRGRLAEAKESATRLKLKLEGLRDSMRDGLDRFESIESLRLDMVVEQAIEARAAQIDYQACLDEIKAIEKALGI